MFPLILHEKGRESKSFVGDPPCVLPASRNYDRIASTLTMVNLKINKQIGAVGKPRLPYEWWVRLGNLATTAREGNSKIYYN